mmetsp:Transcript_39791/g.76208  ORF Transcript_39791/g.76208 Transcript_39791/m.76208 type:complete len:908 (-) Transcript_39791:68-2791(-)
MVASNIKVYIRVRPSAKPSNAFSSVEDDGIVKFELDKHNAVGEVNNSRTNYKFKFDGILGMKINQEQVFDVVAKPVIEDVLRGINGTIFAYGQTGSGKTFTITGGAERYADRGLIPRTISYLFEAFKERNESQFSLYISYLEIYNNDGYDLLSREDTAQKLEDLPKVMLREDDDGNIHLRNLSVNTAQKVEDALNLLFLGDTNRVVAETPMNDASTRSHCMFILWVDSTSPGSDTVRRAKLHLVDLAGSERISKTGVEGNLQKEARCINLSLFYLEQVIVALHSKSQGKGSHIPYRNSMMTSVLRDSLGGNCKTVMVGAMAVEDHCIDESISTCTFAQRVASIKNNATINEELDPSLLIKRLKKEVAELRDELKLVSAGVEDAAVELTEADVQDCQKLVSEYLAESDPRAPFMCGSVQRFRECFKILRDVYWQRQERGTARGGGSGGVGSAVGSAGGIPAVGGTSTGTTRSMHELGGLEARVRKLRIEKAQRDQEIGLLVNSLGKQNKGREAQSAVKEGRVFIKAAPRQLLDSDEVAAPHNSDGDPGVGGTNQKQQSEVPDSASANARQDVSAACSASSTDVPAAVPSAAALGSSTTASLLLDRNKAFEHFRKSVRRAEVAEENRERGRQLVEEATRRGERANALRTQIALKQSRIETLRVQRLMESGHPRNQEAEVRPGSADSPEVTTLLGEIDEHKAEFHQCAARLKQVKVELDSYKRSCEMSRQRLQADFEAWFFALQASTRTDGMHPSVPAPQRATGQAWPAPLEEPPQAKAAASVQAAALPTSTTGTGRIGGLASPASEPASSAKPSPKGTHGAPQGLYRSKPSVEDQPVRAWGAKPQESVTCDSIVRGSSQNGLHVQNGASSMSTASTGAASGVCTPKVTGDAQTDTEIAAFYEALKGLQR